MRHVYSAVSYDKKMHYASGGEKRPKRKKKKKKKKKRKEEGESSKCTRVHNEAPEGRLAG